MKRIILIILTGILLIPAISDAQRWKRQRYEFSAGVGVTNFLGELGGANQIGTHYFKDLEWSMTRLAISAGLRYKLSNYFALKTNATYGRVSGNDNLTTEPFRMHRNLNFFSDIYELNINFEGAFQQEQIGHRYHLRKIKGLRGYEIYTYAFAGIGVFYFDPKTEFNGSTIRLQPLGTEGQGLIPSRSKYSLIQFCIPVGIGFKYTLDRSWGIGLELGIRKTFTDYIDDVSTTYFDFPQNAEYAHVAAVANPHLAWDSEHQNTFAAGQQRGDPRNKDSYMFGIFSINYKLKTGRGNLPRF